MSPPSSKQPEENSYSPGLREEVTSLAKGTGDFLSARAELLSIEGKEAAGLLSKRLARFAIGILFLIFAYFLILAGGVHFLGIFMSEKLTGPFAGWAGAALIISVLHLILAIIFISKARSRSERPLFELTRSEWQKDQQWLSQKSNKES